MITLSARNMSETISLSAEVSFNVGMFRLDKSKDCVISLTIRSA